MEKIQCPKCKGSSVKSGLQNKVQRYKCKNCSHRFQLSYKYKAYQSNVNALIKILLKEGCSVLSISRIIGISKNTVLSRKLKLGNQVKIPNFTELGCNWKIRVK